MQELEKIDEAEEFIDRVGKERAENYDDIIKTPMYLKKMKLKVKQGDYGTPQEVSQYHDIIVVLILSQFAFNCYSSLKISISSSQIVKSTMD